MGDSSGDIEVWKGERFEVNMVLIYKIFAAMKPQEVQEELKLNQLKDKIWYVVPSCATSGEGLFEGLVSSLPTSHLPSSPSSLPFPNILNSIFLSSYPITLSINHRQSPEHS